MSRAAAQPTLRGGLGLRRPSAEPPVGSIRARAACQKAFASRGGSAAAEVRPLSRPAVTGRRVGGLLGGVGSRRGRAGPSGAAGLPEVIQRAERGCYAAADAYTHQPGAAR